MYASFIRNRTRQAFDDLSAGRVDEHVERFHDDASLRIDRDGSVSTFEGSAAIHAAMREEFGGGGRHAFEVDEIVVTGWPHRTRIAVLWTDTGTSGPRRGMNLIRLRWGRVTEEFLFAGAEQPDAEGSWQ